MRRERAAGTEGSAGHRALALACVVALAACASAPAPEARDVADANDTGSAVGPRSQEERAVLSALPSLPNGQPRKVAEAMVVAEPAYAAASGRTCRAVQLSSSKSGKTSHRLACTSGRDWFFVPDVFGTNDAGN